MIRRRDDGDDNDTWAWLVTTPRAAAVAFEPGLTTLVPATAGAIRRAVFLILYRVLSLFFATDRTTVVDDIDKYLAPTLLILLIGIVAWAVVDPVGSSSSRRSGAKTMPTNRSSCP